MRDEERSKQGQTNKKAKQHSTPKAITFPEKNELPCIYKHCTISQCTCNWHKLKMESIAYVQKNVILEECAYYRDGVWRNVHTTEME